MRQLLRQPLPASHETAAAASHWITRHPSARTLAIFSALPGEVDLSRLLTEHPDRRWVFPRVVGEDLTFHHVTHPSSNLVAGPFGLLEPRHDLPCVPLPEIDAFFCPGLAFDARGGRLGHGRGFYDRALALARPDARKIGICRPFQRVPDTFSERHDIAMDEIISA